MASRRVFLLPGGVRGSRGRGDPAQVADHDAVQGGVGLPVEAVAVGLPGDASTGRTLHQPNWCFPGESLGWHVKNSLTKRISKVGRFQAACGSMRQRSRPSR